MTFLEDKEGGQIVVKALTWIGPIKENKATKDGKERTYYNFFMKGAFQVFKSVDYSTIEEAEEDHANVLTTLDNSI